MEEVMTLVQTLARTICHSQQHRWRWSGREVVANRHLHGMRPRAMHFGHTRLVVSHPMNLKICLFWRIFWILLLLKGFVSRLDKVNLLFSRRSTTCSCSFVAEPFDSTKCKAVAPALSHNWNKFLRWICYYFVSKLSTYILICGNNTIYMMRLSFYSVFLLNLFSY